MLAVVAIRNRCSSAFWRNPTAYTPYGVCCARSTVFLAAHARELAFIRGKNNK
jgi:hypothetical protein